MVFSCVRGAPWLGGGRKTLGAVLRSARQPEHVEEPRSGQKVAYRGLFWVVVRVTDRGVDLQREIRPSLIDRRHGISPRLVTAVTE